MKWIKTKTGIFWLYHFEWPEHRFRQSPNSKCQYGRKMTHIYTPKWKREMWRWTNLPKKNYTMKLRSVFLKWTLDFRVQTTSHQVIMSGCFTPLWYEYDGNCLFTTNNLIYLIRVFIYPWKVEGHCLVSSHVHCKIEGRRPNV